MMDELLFRQCRDFVEEQGSGEWSDDLVEGDARKMVEFIERIRPARPKLNMEATPEIVAMLDGSAAREDEARWLTDQAIKIVSVEVRAGTGNQDLTKALKMAHQVLKMARRQVAETGNLVAEDC